MKPRWVKPKVYEVTVVRTLGGSIVEVYFEYDARLVNIMGRLKGRYRKTPFKHWEFLQSKEQEIIDTLRKARYKVTIIQKRQEFPDAPEITEMLGSCPTCGHYGFYGRDRMCGRCR